MEAEMKVRALTIAALFAVVMVVSAIPAAAQGKQARFMVPFEFSVDNKVLPAGEYTVISAGEYIMVRNKNGKHTTISLPSRRTGSWRKVNELALAFTLYDDQYHLSKVWLQDGIGRELRSKPRSVVATNVRTVELVARTR